MTRSPLAAIVRHSPYRLLFPVGAVLGALGVGTWLAFFAQVLPIYRGHEHALVQVQGFLLALAWGFLATMLPRRLSAPRAGAAAIVLSALSLVVTTVALLARQPLVAQGSAFLFSLGLLVFVLRRLRPPLGGRRPPDAFVLIPIALVQAVIGSLLLFLAELGVVGSGGVAMASTMLQQGVFLAFVLGVGRFAVPVLLGWPRPPDASDERDSRRARWGWTALGLGLIATFPLQQALATGVDPIVGLRVGHGLRAVLVLAGFVALRTWRRPAKKGTQRTLLWLSVWLTPLGLVLATAFPSLRIAFLHVTFIGGFGLMALAVGAHVTMGHGGHEALMNVRSWPLRMVGALVLGALAARVAADLWPDEYWSHLAYASGTWLLGLGVWAAFVFPKALRRRVDGKPIVPPDAG